MSALTKNRKTTQPAAKKQAGSALTQDRFQVASTVDDLNAQKARTEAEIAKRGGNAPNLQARLEQINQSIAAQGQAQQTQQQQQQQMPDAQGFGQATGQANQYMQNVFNALQSQGQFNPQGLPQLGQDYSQMRQQAEQVAMDSFNRNMQPRFQQEEADFRQRMAEQGVDETSESFQRQFKDLKDNQNNAFLNAQSQAFQLGQGEQAQAYGQNLASRGQMFNEQFQGYQLPLAQLNAMAPYYGYQNQANMQLGQQNWQGGQNALDRSHQMGLAQFQQGGAMDLQRLQGRQALQQIAATPRGGGGGYNGMPLDQQLQLLDRQFYNQMVLQGMQNGQQVPLPGAAGGFMQGMAQGAGAGLGSALR